MKARQSSDWRAFFRLARPVSVTQGHSMKPTVGRIVWYYPPSPVNTSPLAAIITAVWSDQYVNLAIFSRNGEPWPNPPTSILLVQGDMTRPEGDFCEWMPYQLQKAAEEKAAGLDPDMGVVAAAAVAVPNDTPEAGGPAAV